MLSVHDAINDEDEVPKKIHEHLGRIFELEYAVKDIIHNVDIHAKSGDIEHLSKFNLFITQAK